MFTRLRTAAPLAVVGSAALVLTSAGGAVAATGTGVSVVTATVLSAAAVTATPITFGSYNPVTASGDSATSTVSVTATAGTPYQVGINAGLGSGATVTTRKMTSGTNTLAYSVFTDAGHTNVWGNTPNTDTVGGTGTGLQQNLTAYAHIPSGQSAPTGAYTDTLTVTVTY